MPHREFHGGTTENIFVVRAAPRLDTHHGISRGWYKMYSDMGPRLREKRPEQLEIPLSATNIHDEAPHGRFPDGCRASSHGLSQDISRHDPQRVLQPGRNGCWCLVHRMAASSNKYHPERTLPIAKHLRSFEVILHCKLEN